MPKGIYQRSEKTYAKISITLKKMWQNPEYRKHMSEAHKGQHSSPRTEIKKGQRLSPKTEFKKGQSPIMGFKKGHISWAKGKKFPERSGENSSCWKTGKTLGSDGSILVRRPNHPFCNKSGYILEHRLIVEQQIGRYLTPEEVVHHLNGVRSDNRPKNLMGFINDPVHKHFHKNPQLVKPEEIIFNGRLL